MHIAKRMSWIGTETAGEIARKLGQIPAGERQSNQVFTTEQLPDQRQLKARIRELGRQSCAILDRMELNGKNDADVREYRALTAEIEKINVRLGLPSREALGYPAVPFTL